MKTKLIEEFRRIFAVEPEGHYFAPGRINLIGEHTDYNGGHVFPCAISLGTYALARCRNDRKLRLYSMNFQELGIIELSLDDLTYRKTDNWTNYVKGVISYLQNRTKEFPYGLDIMYFGNIPNGAGLSSSASLELLTGVLLKKIFGLNISTLELVKLGQEVENKYIGVNSGIMDQFAIGMSKKDQAILLDCTSLAYDLVPLKLGNYAIIIMNTNKRRELADSKYNERRSECEEALGRLQTQLKINSLGELDEATFAAYRHVIQDPVLEKRALHAVSENQRTLKAKAALLNDDLTMFGKLMNASHQSLQQGYEVTGIELDTLIAAAQQQPGVLGARMTGAGFGGCGIALVEETSISTFIEQVGALYQKEIGYPASFYQAKTHDGAGEIKEEY